MDVMAEAERDRAELVALLETLTEEEWSSPSLCEGWTLIHQPDVRRPLDRPREIAADPVRFALRLAVTSPALLGGWRTRGVRLVAENVDWSTGRGPEARGTGEAVLMTLAGRPAALADLTGDGVRVLRPR